MYKSEDHRSGFEHVEFRVPLKHPKAGIAQGAETRRSVELRGEIQAIDKNL